MKINISQGSVQVNSIALIKQTPDLIALYADTREKWPQLDSASHNSIWIIPNGKFAKEDDIPTEVCLPEIDDDSWLIITECSRYSVFIIFLKKDSLDMKNQMWLSNEL